MPTAATELTELTEAQRAEIMLDRYTQMVANVRKSILEEMTPLEIAQMIATHFDEAPEDTLDTAKALVQEFTKDFPTSRADAHRWADEAFNV
jgi:hypothetical protein